MYIVLYHPDIDQFLTAPTPPQRADGTVDIALPNHFQAGQGHVWLFMADRKGRNVSRSGCTGCHRRSGKLCDKLGAAAVGQEAIGSEYTALRIGGLSNGKSKCC